MKNFLIPTTLKEDTIGAVKTAVNLAKGNDCKIILMLISETPDTYSSPSSFLREIINKSTANEENILHICREIVSKFDNCSLKIHNQYGISSPVFKRIIEHFSLNLIIVTHSYHQEEKRIIQNLVQLLDNQKCPILHLGAMENQDVFNKALYIENTASTIPIEDLQQFITKNFCSQIVSMTSDIETTNLEEFTPYLTEVINKNGVNLLVKTRKPKKIKLKKSPKQDNIIFLGLSVLSLYEEMVLEHNFQELSLT
ncbi:hypothetical protein [Flavobacterium frigoris]|uniref:UspA domain-containing protein n=1 Tax=Flavobacterium frigoris (strain PS1) TaxID=1086011 RepID=H7FQH0_FLAFP|nr:hypothetical protein [Flavobacterium frigoris]EIA09524.1 hypothetical protein HJ01_01430 [Flavobacterium frigoris PS1]